MQQKKGDPILMKLHSCSRLRQKVVDRSLAEAGLSDIAQPYTLTLLKRSCDTGGAICQKALAEQMHISPATMASALKTLTRQGYVSRAVDPVDTRRKQVSITDKGRRAVEQCAAVFDGVDALVWTGFSDAERQAMNDYLTRMIGNLNSAQ